MKLRALHLVNVRKFTGQQASITGIGDGVTVVSEANEFGKSTFFDALHALFFEKYSSAAKTVKLLQPRAGGPVEIAAEIETDDGAFRVEKRFLSRKSARVIRLSDRTTIAQDDEAERWVATLLGGAGEGPAGLLWVRQGLVGLEPDGTKEKSQQMESRRDLLSSVAGEIDTMTGGRRMDRVMRRVAEELSVITTKTGRKAGLWKAVAEEVTDLEAKLAELEAKAHSLDEALQARRLCEAELKRLDDPEAKSRREAACALAEEAMQMAEAHAARLHQAEQARDLAVLRESAARRALDDFLAAQDALRLAGLAQQATRARATDVVAQVTAAQANAVQARKTHEAAEARLEVARARLNLALRQVGARRARLDAERLAGEIARAETEARQRDTARARLRASKADAAWLRRAEAAEVEVGRLEQAVVAQSAKARVAYSGEVKLTHQGRQLHDGETILLGPEAEFDLPGIGQLIVTSEGGQSAQEISRELEEAHQARDAIFEEAGVASILEARRAAVQHEEVSRAVDLSERLLESLAPQGIDALKGKKAEADLIAEDASSEDLSPREELETDVEAAKELEATARREEEAGSRHLAQLREDAGAAQASAEAAQRDLDRAIASAGAEETRERRQADLLRAHQTAEGDREAASAVVAELQASAPDLRTFRADLDRAKQAIASVAQRRVQTSERLASLSAEIRALAGGGVEELRDECKERLEQARLREARFARTAESLSRLQSALDAERCAARDAYFGPVREELKPLLSILHGGADLTFDSDTLLPAALSRGEEEEMVETLSGGTQEQIAILTRLAFARLFARQGRRMPIVLDDALVYSDDDRIIKMFTALTRVAVGQQILVFSCRQLAFQDLGGERPRVTLQPA
jgi:uncharacterized protein YhaN